MTIYSNPNYTENVMTFVCMECVVTIAVRLKIYAYKLSRVLLNEPECIMSLSICMECILVVLVVVVE